MNGGPNRLPQPRPALYRIAFGAGAGKRAPVDSVA